MLKEKNFPIEEFRNLYSTKGIFGNIIYGAPIPSKGFKHAIAMCQNWSFRLDPKARILVIGAGAGYELIVFCKYGHECYGIDFYIPNVEAVRERSAIASASAIPFKDKEFDMLFCTEMMEHVPLKMTDKILAECKRVAERFYFTIATVKDTGFNTHINVHPSHFWIKKFEELGFEVEHAEMNPIVYTVIGGKHIIKYPSGNGGVVIYGKC